MRARDWQVLGLALGASWPSWSGSTWLLKFTLQRDLTPVADGAWYRYSFPSGHTVGAAADTGLLILLAAQRRIGRGRANPRRTWAVAVGAWAFLVLSTGVGRVLAQKHWASDVVGSLGIGVALACAILLVAGIPYPASRFAALNMAGEKPA